MVGATAFEALGEFDEILGERGHRITLVFAQFELPDDVDCLSRAQQKAEGVLFIQEAL